MAASGNKLQSAASQCASLLKFGCAMFLFRDTLCEPTVCVGPSMLPTLAARGDVVLAESLSVRRGKIRRGDVVVARPPTNPRHTVCKRVLGVGGDRVAIGDPISASPSNSSSCSSRLSSCSSGTIMVPKGHVWLQGDNARNSTDSRSYGPVPVNSVRARVFFRCWPPSRVGAIAGGPEALEERRGRRWFEQEYRNDNYRDGDRGRRGER